MEKFILFPLCGLMTKNIEKGSELIDIKIEVYIKCLYTEKIDNVSLGTLIVNRYYFVIIFHEERKAKYILLYC